MDELRFDGRVAVVTGAGRGIGRGYALLLAARGASVVVNDLGSSMEGDGSDVGPAQSVVDEIVAAGGKAVADGHDVSTTEGAEAIVATALESFGRIDVLVNNAGIIRYEHLPTLSAADVERHLSVHLLGSFNTMRAAWPHFVEQGYGRIVHTTSTGLFGMDNNLSYAAAKAGTVGMMRSARLDGAPHGILVNCVGPAALTRMAGGAPVGENGMPDDSMLPSASVAPLVAYLAHESCPVSGEVYTAGGGRFARVFIASTEGYVQDGDPSVEDVVAHWAEVNDETGYYLPGSTMEWSGRFMAHRFAGMAQ